jgi:hypothetical protein
MARVQRGPSNAPNLIATQEMPCFLSKDRCQSILAARSKLSPKKNRAYSSADTHRSPKRDAVPKKAGYNSNRDRYQPNSRQHRITPLVEKTAPATLCASLDFTCQQQIYLAKNGRKGASTSVFAKSARWKNEPGRIRSLCSDMQWERTDEFTSIGCLSSRPEGRADVFRNALRGCPRRCRDGPRGTGERPDRIRRGSTRNRTCSGGFGGPGR